jgi:transposase
MGFEVIFALLWGYTVPLSPTSHILDRIHNHKINRLDELLPWNWTPMALQNIQAA